MSLMKMGNTFNELTCYLNDDYIWFTKHVKHKQKNFQTCFEMSCIGVVLALVINIGIKK